MDSEVPEIAIISPVARKPLLPLPLHSCSTDPASTINK